MEWIIEAIQTKKKTPQNEFNENTKTKINIKQKTSLYCCFLLFFSLFFFLADFGWKTIVAKRNRLHDYLLDK